MTNIPGKERQVFPKKSTEKLQYCTCWKVKSPRQSFNCKPVIHLSQAHSLELREHLVMFHGGFIITANWLMGKSETRPENASVEWADLKAVLVTFTWQWSISFFSMLFHTQASSTRKLLVCVCLSICHEISKSEVRLTKRKTLRLKTDNWTSKIDTCEPILLVHQQTDLPQTSNISRFSRPVIEWSACHWDNLLTLKVLVATIDALGHFETG